MTDLALRNGLSYAAKPDRVDFYSAASQRMVVVDVEGDPAQATPTVVPTLYATVYAVRKVYKEQGRPFVVERLRGRWSDDVRAASRSQWKGVYGLPVPDDVKALPDIPPSKRVTGITPRLEIWHYGQLAATLHEGPFASEAETIAALHRQIAEKGLRALPDTHEEIYLSDPRRSAPERYKTLILRRVSPS